MPERPQSWVKNYEDVDFDAALLNKSPSGRSTPNERQHMLADLARPTVGNPSEPNPQPVASSSTLSNPRSSHSRSMSNGSPPNAQEAPAPDSVRATTSDAGPNFLRMPRSSSFKSIGTSPLNPSSPLSTGHPAFASPFGRPGSRGSAYITRIPSEESRALSLGSPFSMNTAGTRGSMILYRRADTLDDTLLPPTLPHGNRNSIISLSGDSFISLSSDSKYPTGMMTPQRGLVAYAYDPTMDEQEPTNDEDHLHDPEEKYVKISGRPASWRGFKNLAALIILVAGLLSLFVVYPVVAFYHSNNRNSLIVGNTRINSTGQATSVSFDERNQPIFSSVDPIDPMTPRDARSLTTLDGETYELAFSDEFEGDGRSFYTGDDQVWEAVDNEFHDPEQITTSNGHLVIRVDSSPSHGNDQTTYVSGVLRSISPVCLDNGFVEVGVILPGQGVKTLYWSGSWSSNDGDLAIVPKGSSLTQLMSLTLSLGIAVGDSGHSTSAPSTPAVMLVDYVRFYQKAVQVASSCDGIRPHQHVDAFLDFF